MRVCMVTTSFPRWEGDFSGNFIRSLSESLVKAGAEVRVVAPAGRGAAPRETLGSVAVHRFGYAAPAGLQVLAYEGGIPHKLRTSSLARLELAPFLASMYRFTCRVARACDLIHAHWVPTGAVAGLAAARLNIPMVLTVHGSDGAYLGSAGLMQRISAFSLRSASHVITVSESLRSRALSSGVAPDRVTTIHNGVDPEAFSLGHAKTGDRKILCVGRMTREKGMEFLIRAAKRITEAHNGTLFWFVGDGPDRPGLEELARELGLTDSVSFLGRRDHSEMSGLYAESDLVVLPSLSEGLPAVLLEAMASGKPVVATRVGGVPELITHGENGYLVSPGSAEEIAEGVIGLLDRPEEGEMMGAFSRHLVETTHTWGATSSKVMSVYTSVVGKKRR